jgi:hypothetical protein
MVWMWFEVVVDYESLIAESHPLVANRRTLSQTCRFAGDRTLNGCQRSLRGRVVCGVGRWRVSLPLGDAALGQRLCKQPKNSRLVRPPTHGQPCSPGSVWFRTPVAGLA